MAHKQYSRNLSPAERAVVNESYPMRYIQLYGKAEATDLGKALGKRIAEDPRVIALAGLSLWHGGVGKTIWIPSFVRWYMWFSDRNGETAAEQALNDFLDGKDMPGLVTQWVCGVEVKDTIPLGDGYAVRPISAMPESAEKEEFPKFVFLSGRNSPPGPACAIVCHCLVPRSLTHENEVADFKKLNLVKRRLHDLGLLINALDGMSAVTHLATTYYEDCVPTGPFSGMGGSQVIHDIIGDDVEELTPEAATLLLPLAVRLEARPQKEQVLFRSVLSRLCQAKRAERIEDKVLDLSIALEMLLLADNREHNQLSLMFRLRGAWLLARSPEERLSLCVIFKKIYQERSSVAHSGALHDTDAARAALPEWLNLGSRVFRKRLEINEIDWDKLVLNIAT